MGMQLSKKHAIIIPFLITALMFTLWFQFFSGTGQVYGYSLKHNGDYKTDVDYYLEKDLFSMPFGRVVPVTILEFLGDFLGSFFIWMFSYFAISIALEKKSERMCRRDLSFTQSAFVFIFVALITFYMMTIGFYSQLLATAFLILLLTLTPDIKYAIMWFVVLNMLLIFSHPKGIFIIAILWILAILDQTRLKWLGANSRDFFIIWGIIGAIVAGYVFPLLVYLGFLIPKTALYAMIADRRYFQGVYGTWILLSFLFLAIDSNIRTFFLGILLLIPAAVITIGRTTTSHRRSFMLVFLLEVIFAILWTWGYYFSNFVA